MMAGKMWQWEVRADSWAVTSSAADVRQRGNWRWRKAKSSWSPPSGTCFPQPGCTSWKIDNIFSMAPPAGNQVFEALCTWKTFLIPITLPSHLIRNIKGNYLESKQVVHMGTDVTLTSKEHEGRLSSGGTENTQGRKTSFFNSCSWGNCLTTYKRMNWDTCLHQLQNNLNTR